jgi:hypothetical protein
MLKGLKRLLEEVPRNSEFEMVEFALQGALQDEPFALSRYWKLSESIDEGSGVLGFGCNELLDKGRGAYGSAAGNHAISSMLDPKGLGHSVGEVRIGGVCCALVE